MIQAKLADFPYINEWEVINRLISEFARTYQLPLPKMDELSSHRKLKIACWKSSQYRWEKELYGDLVATSFIFRDKVFRRQIINLARSYCIPLLERYYQTGIEDIYLFFGEKTIDPINGYGIYIFKKDLPTQFDGGEKNSLEDIFAAAVAKRVKTIFGRGPKKAKAYLLDRKFTVCILNNILSEAEMGFAQMNEENYTVIENMVEYHIRDAIMFVQKELLGGQYEIFTQLEVGTNTVVALMVDVLGK